MRHFRENNHRLGGGKLSTNKTIPLKSAFKKDHNKLYQEENNI